MTARARALIVAATAAAVAAAAVAWGHAALVRSTPPNRAVVAQAPARVELWFSERIEPAYARLSVADAGNRTVDDGDVTVGPDDPRRLSVAVPALAPGLYLARYRVLSVDGHVVEGTLRFTVRPRP